jgi:hypothetical protein
MRSGERKPAYQPSGRLEREALEFELAAGVFSRRHKLKRVCVGPNETGCPERITDPTILEVGHIGGGGGKEREAVKKFAFANRIRVRNKRPGGRVYLMLLNEAEAAGYKPDTRFGWQCANCNKREHLAKTIAARRAVREQLRVRAG